MTFLVSFPYTSEVTKLGKKMRIACPYCKRTHRSVSNIEKCKRAIAKKKLGGATHKLVSGRAVKL